MCLSYQAWGQRLQDRMGCWTLQDCIVRQIHGISGWILNGNVCNCAYLSCDGMPRTWIDCGAMAVNRQMQVAPLDL